MIKPSWLNDAVFYEIYPQSFYDTNGDGIGDLEGIIQKLPYIQSIGVNAIWLNPIFDSPFEDAGYDVRDYYKVAERYGTNDDFARLCAEAKKIGIRILCDLVPCHTSIEHPMFIKSKENKNNEYSNRFIWCDDPNYQSDKLYSAKDGRSDRYYASFYDCQPALNFGFANPTESWMSSPDAPECIENQKMLCDIMDYWISLGSSGFRVDMAGSLVKDDEDYTETKKVWQKIRKYMDEKHPDCVLISEWSRPFHAIDGGFHMDMNLTGGSLFRFEKKDDPTKKSYFRKEGEGNFSLFADDYPNILEHIKGRGLYSFVTGNHDSQRLQRFRTDEEIKCALAFIFTMPGAPILYYGDEIGMHHIYNTETEGSNGRGAARTPMQWENGKKNFGFSTSDTLYLNQDDNPDAPTVQKEENDPDSILNYVRNLIALRKNHKALDVEASWVYANKGQNYPLWYKRINDDEIISVMINTTSQEFEFDSVNEIDNVLISINADIEEKIHLNPFSVLIFVSKK